MYDSFNRRSEIQDYKIIKIEKSDTSQAKKWAENNFRFSLNVEDEYEVTATMEIRYRCDYDEEYIIDSGLYAKDEPYCYNGLWSEWQTVSHTYLMYKIDGEWYVLGADNEDGSS